MRIFAGFQRPPESQCYLFSILATDLPYNIPCTKFGLNPKTLGRYNCGQDAAWYNEGLYKEHRQLATQKSQFRNMFIYEAELITQIMADTALRIHTKFFKSVCICYHQDICRTQKDNPGGNVKLSCLKNWDNKKKT
jgi:hypothetical protein